MRADGVVFSPRPHRRTLRGRLYTALQGLRGFPLDRYARELAAAEALPSADFDRRNAGLLEAALAFARSEVPLYQGGNWARVQSAPGAGLAPWPVIDRQVLLEHYDELRARTPGGGAVTHHTSGSTGTFAKVTLSREAETWGWAHRYRGLLWHGLPIGVRAMRLSHAPRPLRDFLLNQGCFRNLGEPGAVDAAFAYLRKRRPLLVTGAPSKLFYLARGLRERGHEGPLAPFARVGGEQLFPFQRAAIERHVCARALDSYGCTEVGAIAGECEAGSMHVYEDHVHVEIFDGDVPAKTGEFGDVVVTALRNRAMPLIRYRVDDRARLLTERCRCGLPHPVIAEIQARAVDTFTASDGTRRHASELVFPLASVYESPEADGIRQIQFEQLDGNGWRVWLERRAPGLVAAALEDRLSDLVRAVAGPDSHVEFRTADDLARVSGKFRYYRLRAGA